MRRICRSSHRSGGRADTVFDMSGDGIHGVIEAIRTRQDRVRSSRCGTRSPPGAHVEFKLIGIALPTDLTTQSEQNNTQQGYNLSHEIHFSVPLSGVTSISRGFGFQFTGTVSAGNCPELESQQVTLTPQ